MARPRVIFLDDVYRLASKALRNGATRLSTGTIHWDIAGNCQRPYRSNFFARPSRSDTNKYVVVGKNTPIPMEVVLFTRCRECEKCLAHRASLWRARISAEIQHAPRTWFGTLTLTPERQYYALIQASARARSRGVLLAELPEREQWLLRHAVITKEITKYLKRVRHHTEGPLRYVCVAERHKSGDPHYHMLVHDPYDLVRHKVLTKAWHWGFTKWKLVTGPNPQNYVAKYVGKDLGARVRASKSYGNPPIGITPDLGGVGYRDPEKVGFYP